MEGLDVVSILKWVASMIGAVTAIGGAVLGFSKNAREWFKSIVRKNSDADDMREEIENLKKAVNDLIALQTNNDEAQRQALQAMLRHEITDIYYRHLEDKKLAAYEKEDMIKMAKAYEINGGNSYIQTIVAEMKGWDLTV